MEPSYFLMRVSSGDVIADAAVEKEVFRNN